MLRSMLRSFCSQEDSSFSLPPDCSPAQSSQSLHTRNHPFPPCPFSLHIPASCSASEAGFGGVQAGSMDPWAAMGLSPSASPDEVNGGSCARLPPPVRLLLYWLGA